MWYSLAQTTQSKLNQVGSVHQSMPIRQVRQNNTKQVIIWEIPVYFCSDDIDSFFTLLAGILRIWLQLVHFSVTSRIYIIIVNCIQGLCDAQWIFCILISLENISKCHIARARASTLNMFKLLRHRFDSGIVRYHDVSSLCSANRKSCSPMLIFPGVAFPCFPYF